MFTGIIEELAEVTAIQKEGSNTHFLFRSTITSELKVDQSVAHNGVCLTVVEIKGQEYRVTAIAETLKLTNLSLLKVGDQVNLERCMPANGRFDGHIVQGHVDGVAVCEGIQDEDGSKIFTFRPEHPEWKDLIVKKGSVCVNGISLTVVDVSHQAFSVAIIPYTLEVTNLHTLEKGSLVNLEFDILGKYIARQLKNRGL